MGWREKQGLGNGLLVRGLLLFHVLIRTCRECGIFNGMLRN
jgi:hypothetical protein